MRRLVWALLVLLPVIALAQEPDIVIRTRKQLGKLKKDLEGIRGEKLKTEVAVASATSESLSGESDDIDPRYDTRGEQIARAYARIGLFPKGYDLGNFMKAFGSSVLAYYEPKKRTFFVVNTEMGDATADSTAVHELMHALQDQRFDLVKYYHFNKDPDPIAMNDDATLARRLIVEGEASYVHTIWEAQRENALDKVEPFLEERATLSRNDLSRMERKAAARVEGGKNYMKALNAQDTLPLYLYRQMLDPYLKGPAIIARVKKQGGWKAVDDLYTNPPASTKQILHLEKLRAPLDPVEIPDLAIIIGSGYKRTFENTFGEMGVTCILEARALQRKAPAVAAKIAETWTGDRFQAYENAARDTIALWLTAWENDAAAKEFEAAGKEILKGEGSTTTDSLVERRGKRVLLVLGAPRKKGKPLVEAVLGERK